MKRECFESSHIKQEEDTFDYETEALPLKGNKDYLALVRHLSMLTAMRSQALKDIDQVLAVQENALADPLGFVEKLQRGEDIGVPCRLTVPEMPDIDWSKYQTPAFRFTRPKNRDIKSESEKLPNQNPTAAEGEVVRGRVKSKSKPATFNQLWSPEEQIRLEELLIQFPHERNESARFKKIADALGNRTLAQVTSRCQKYFEKLQKAGLPVPGRAPRLRKDTLVKNPRAKSSVFQPSTFFPRTLPPVTFRDDDLPGTSTVQLSHIKVEAMETEDSDVTVIDEPWKIALLRRVRADVANNSCEAAAHPGYKCVSCKQEPIYGSRWHCMECPAVDFCSECLIHELEVDETVSAHPMDHPFALCREERTTNGENDKDYNLDLEQYNYLDVTFHPH